MSWLAWFHALDLRALYAINQTWSRTWLDPLMARVSDFDSWRYPLYAAVGLTLIFGEFRGRLLIVLMALCLLLGDKGVGDGLKRLVGRPRPNETEPHLRVVTVSGVTESEPRQPQAGRRGNSFTSGHACNNVALAVVGCAIFGRWAWWLWPWAGLVSYSRIYTASHYPSDIVGSWIVAMSYALLICGLAAWGWRRYAPAQFPRLYARHPRLFPLYEAVAEPARTP